MDENINPALRAGLRKKAPEIVAWAVGDPGTPQRGTLDPEILRWCDANNFSLVTNNRSTMPVHLRDHIAAGGEVPGIFILNPAMTMGETIEELALIHGASQAEEYVNLLEYLPVSA